jgi:hypothetical protein
MHDHGRTHPPLVQWLGGLSFFGNLVILRRSAILLGTMSHMPESIAPDSSSSSSRQLAQERPFRVKLRGSVLTLIRLPNQRQIRGKLHQLSISGGLVHLEKPLDEKLKVEFIFHLGNTTVRERAEIMFPMWATQGWLQPFRFVELPEATRSALETTLLSFIQSVQEPAS